MALNRTVRKFQFKLLTIEKFDLMYSLRHLMLAMPRATFLEPQVRGKGPKSANRLFDPKSGKCFTVRAQQQQWYSKYPSDFDYVKKKICCITKIEKMEELVEPHGKSKKKAETPLKSH
jgi:hypothetical protein